MKRLTWISSEYKVVFQQKVGAELYIDMNSFDCNSVSGVFDQFIVPLRDGIYIHGTRLGEKYISFKFQYDARKHSESEISEFREYISEAFNPKIKGTLIYEDESKYRQIECYPQRIPLLEERNRRILFYTIELISEKSFWDGYEERIELGHAINHGMPLLFGHSIGYNTPLSSVYNDTQHNIYPIIEMYGNAKLENEKNHIFIEIDEFPEKTEIIMGSGGQIPGQPLNGKIIKVPGKIVIDTYLDKATLYWRNNDGLWEEEGDATVYLTNESGRLYLEPGVNPLIITSGTDPEPYARITYRRKYLGV